VVTALNPSYPARNRLRAIAAALFVLILKAGDAAAVRERRPPAKHPVLRQYRKKVFRKESAARALASSGINTARNPHEWGGGAQGFARRVGSAFG
jgi:hypothetical protein